MRTLIFAALLLAGCSTPRHPQQVIYPGEDRLCPGMRDQEAYWVSRGNATLAELYRKDMDKYGCRR